MLGIDIVHHFRKIENVRDNSSFSGPLVDNQIDTWNIMIICRSSMAGFLIGDGMSNIIIMEALKAIRQGEYKHTPPVLNWKNLIQTKSEKVVSEYTYETRYYLETTFRTFFTTKYKPNEEEFKETARLLALNMSNQIFDEFRIPLLEMERALHDNDLPAAKESLRTIYKKMFTLELL